MLRQKVHPRSNVFFGEPATHELLEVRVFIKVFLCPMRVNWIEAAFLQEKVGGDEAVPRVAHKSELEILPEFPRIGLFILRVRHVPGASTEQRLGKAGSCRLRDMNEDAFE